jgi:hypothetical protein
MGFSDLYAKPLKLLGDIPASSLRIIRQKKKWHPLRLQLLNELVRPGDQFSSPINHSVHIDQIAWH